MLRIAKLVVLLTLVVMAVGCGRKAAALNGTWQVDVEKQLTSLKESEPYKKMPDPMKKRMEEGMRGVLGSMSFTFQDGKFVAKMPNASEESDYKVTAQDGDRWTLEMTSKKKNTPENITVTWTDNDHLAITLPTASLQMNELFLVRQK